MASDKATYCRCLYYSANALARILTKMAEEEFAPVGLAPSYGFLLMNVNAHPGIQPTEVADHMMLAASTVTRLVEKMEDEGYLKREREGKAIHIYPTAKSKRLDPKIKACWRNLFARYSELLGKDESQKLTQDIFSAALTLET
ncbi:MAG: winged helix-turn-helix transcriptional regulator [Calditrichaeota bacterium]|nr:winged helix-turn-helix transcriptional regulator [Calditrichota bacterium]